MSKEDGEGERVFGLCTNKEMVRKIHILLREGYFGETVGEAPVILASERMRQIERWDGLVGGPDGMRTR